jgi:putative oxidoreductase
MMTTFVLAVPRIVVGLLMAGHGLQKLAGWFGGSGLQGTAHLLDNLRVRGASRWAVALALAETIGGVLMALGLPSRSASCWSLRCSSSRSRSSTGRRGCGP